jgi:hypothetical protein
MNEQQDSHDTVEIVETNSSIKNSGEDDTIANKKTEMKSHTDTRNEKLQTSVGVEDNNPEKPSDDGDFDDTVIIKNEKDESGVKEKKRLTIVQSGSEREESEKKNTTEVNRQEGTKRSWALRWDQFKKNRSVPFFKHPLKKPENEKNTDINNENENENANENNTTSKHNLKELSKHSLEKEKKKIKEKEKERDKEKELLERLEKVEKELQVKETELKTLQSTNQELTQRVEKLQRDLEILQRERDLLQQQQQQQQQQQPQPQRQGNVLEFENLQKEVEMLRRTLHHEVQARYMLQEGYERQILEKHTVDYTHINRLLTLQLVLWSLVVALFLYSFFS